MGDKTRNDLRDSSMREIKKLANGEELSAEDSTYVLDKIDGVYAELKERKIAYWDSEQIPDAMMPWLTRVVAADIAGRYTSTGEADRFLGMRGPGIRELDRLTKRIEPTTDPAEKYF